MRALDRPGNDVLEAAEHRDPSARFIGCAPAVIRLDTSPAPVAALHLESPYVADLRIVVLEGDETGQELLEQSLRVLDPEVTQVDVQLDHFDLSLDNRRKTNNAVASEAAAAIREAGLSIKAATVTPEGADDVGSPNRILREQIDGKVIIR